MYIFWHTINLAVVNAWLLYKRDFKALKSEAGYSKEAYLAKILSSLLSIPLKENDIEIAHRIGPLVKNVPRPRTVIFKLHHLQKKLSIVETAGSIVLEPTDLSGVRLRISEDISRPKSSYAPGHPPWASTATHHSYPSPCATSSCQPGSPPS
ncbi:unnamed protein product [Gadus morhua 'NCC']